MIFEIGTQIFSENSLTVKKSGIATLSHVLSTNVCLISSIAFSFFHSLDFFDLLKLPSSSSQYHHLNLNDFFAQNFFSEKLDWLKSVLFLSVLNHGLKNSFFAQNLAWITSLSMLASSLITFTTFFSISAGFSIFSFFSYMKPSSPFSHFFSTGFSNLLGSHSFLISFLNSYLGSFSSFFSIFLGACSKLITLIGFFNLIFCSTGTSLKETSSLISEISSVGSSAFFALIFNFKAGFFSWIDSLKLVVPICE